MLKCGVPGRKCTASMLEGEQSLHELDVHWNDHDVIHLKWSPHEAPLTYRLVVSTVLWRSPKSAGSQTVSVRALNLRTSPRVRGKQRVKDVRGSPVLLLMHLCQWPCKEWPGCGDRRCCLLQLEELDCVQAADRCWVWKWLVLILGYHHQSPWFIITILEAGLQQFTFPLWEWEGTGNSCFPLPCSCPKGDTLSTILSAFRKTHNPRACYC